MNLIGGAAGCTRMNCCRPLTLPCRRNLTKMRPWRLPAEDRGEPQMYGQSGRKHRRIDMIILYHCHGARSFRPLWMLEEMGLPYELKMLPFPPRVLAKDYLGINPLGTIPFMIDG